MDTTMRGLALPNRPGNKLPPVSKGFRVQKRPLTRRPPLVLSHVDMDGYASPSFCTPGGIVLRPPPCVYVGTKTPFMGIVKRVRKALEKGGAQPRSTRGLPLTARVAALSTGGRSTSSRGGNNSDDGPDGTGESDEGEVIVVGTGRAIEKTLNVAAWFQKQSDCQVSLRTRSVAAVDDIVLGRANNTNADGDWDIDADPDDADGEQEDEVDPDAEEHSRIRMMSCLEVSVRLRGM